MAIVSAPEKLVAGFYEIEVARLTPHPRNIRKDLGDLTELTASIIDKGILEPLLVAADGGFVVCGHRRLAAAIEAGRLRVPCVVSDINDHYAIELMLIENMQRNGLTPVEEAAAYQQLLDFGQTADEISTNVSVNADRVRRRVALLQLPNSARNLLETHRITIGAAEELLQLKGHDAEIERMIDIAGFFEEDRPIRDTPMASFGWQISEAKRRVKEIEDREAAQAKIEKEGLKVVEMPNAYDTRKTVPRRLGTGYGEINTPVGAHRKLACHAVAISSSGKLISVCTKPKNHPQAAPKAAETRKDSRDYQAEADEHEQARVRRIDVLRDFCMTHQSGSAEVSALAVMARNRYGEVDDGVVCNLLGISHAIDAPAVAFTKWLVEGASTISGSMPVPTTARLATGRLAIDLAFLESSYEDGNDIATPWLLFLRGLGYDPTEEERELFDANLVVSWAKTPANAFA